MRSAASVILAAAAAGVWAQDASFNPIYTPNTKDGCQLGQDCVITWGAQNHVNEPVSIELIGGCDPNRLQPVAALDGGVILKSIVNKEEKYTWKVPGVDKIGHHVTYGIVMRLISNPNIFQYSMPFAIGGNDAFCPDDPSATTPSAPDSTTTKDNHGPTTEAPTTTPHHDEPKETTTAGSGHEGGNGKGDGKGDGKDHEGHGDHENPEDCVETTKTTTTTSTITIPGEDCDCEEPTAVPGYHNTTIPQVPGGGKNEGEVPSTPEGPGAPEVPGQESNIVPEVPGESNEIGTSVPTGGAVPSDIPEIGSASGLALNAGLALVAGFVALAAL